MAQIANTLCQSVRLDFVDGLFTQCFIVRIPTSSSMPLKYRGPKAHLPIARSAFHGVNPVFFQALQDSFVHIDSVLIQVIFSRHGIVRSRDVVPICVPPSFSIEEMPASIDVNPEMKSPKSNGKRVRSRFSFTTLYYGSLMVVVACWYVFSPTSQL